jgi:hypothetical protein
MSKPKYYRDGIEIDAARALDRNGVLRDGFTMRVPLTMRDSLSPLQRSVADSTARDNNRITDGRSDDPTALNRPGFRIRTNDIRQKVMDAYQDYEDALVNAYRCDDEERDGSEDFCGASTSRESLPRHRADSEMMQDHQTRMNKLYADRDRELSEMWRSR